MKKLTYKQAGVDIAKAAAFKRRIKALVRKSFTKAVLKDIGGFGGFFSFPKADFRQPVLVSSTDGVGSKLKLAALVNKHDTIGIDAVAMNVNDILCAGAKPLFFLDYIAFSRVKPAVLRDVVKGITSGCLQAGCALVGGETAQMPGMYADGEYDIAGFCVGVAEKGRIIDGSQIRPGDKILGLASSGIHSNGYSLVRKVFSPAELKRLSAELLKPTRIYVKPVFDLLYASRKSGIPPTVMRTAGKRYTLNAKIHGISHITGGAFYDKIARILPEDTDALIRKGSWPVPEIFKLIQRKGGIVDREMYHTFNMGIGMALIMPEKFIAGSQARLKKFNLHSWVIGEITKGTGRVAVA